MADFELNQRINSVFELYRQIMSVLDDQVNDMMDTVSCFMEQKNDLIQKLPFHLNVIDELHINENAHSRIIAKLLTYRRDGKWVVLESLLEYVAAVSNLESFKQIKISKPIITQEEERIDIWIRDKEYAIILENKVYNAIDQDEQLSRYIEKTIKRDYKIEQIYVLYMPQTFSEPDEQSWGQYKNDFTNRFAIISFKDEVRIWLKEKIMPLFNTASEMHIESALRQYVDYLDGLFNMRESLKSYYMSIERIIADKLGLDDCNNDQERINLLQKTIDDFNGFIQDMTNMLDRIRVNKRSIEIKKCQEDFKSRYSNYRTVEKVLLGYYFKHNNEQYKLIINKGNQSNSRLYCQLEKIIHEEGWTPNNDALMGNRSIRQLLTDPNPDPPTTVIWEYKDPYAVEDVYALFLSVTQELISLGISFEV